MKVDDIAINIFSRELDIIAGEKMAQKKTNRKGGIGVLDQQKRKIKKPKKFKCVMYNDDYTPMDMVVAILLQVFRKDMLTAWKLTMDVHEKDKGIAGVYSREIAETKCANAINIAKAAGYPFLVKAEEE
jgi:ATP-dependent Clp protease adaptor protein ClpS